MIIPYLASQQQLDPLVNQYLTQLRQQGFLGDIASHYADRLSLATDNSVYQQLPQAILFPKEVADVVRLTKLAQRDEFKSLKFTPRGGGTGTNGQSLNSTIIVDLSRHMNQILELNVKEHWVRVQAGVVKDQLNRFLKPHGLFFAPELSTSNRATIGGMVNTDASGQGSLQYGKTSDHVIALRSVLINGDILDTQAISCDNFAENIAQTNLSQTGKQIHQQVEQLCRQHRQQILTQLPQLNRFITGYDLNHVFDAELAQFNLSRILTGSEGSLAFVCEAKLNLLPIPQYRTLINIKYRSFDAALRHAPAMVAAKALSVETVDSKVLNLAKQDIIWHSVSDLLKEEDNSPILGLNIVEYAGNNEKYQQQQVAQLCQRLDQEIVNQQNDVIGYQVCTDLASVEKIYAMRKKAVGLLGNAKGRAKPIPFVEDTCVPPENLADYIADFRALLDKHHLDYGMFGHVDAGVLHVRPALDLCDPEQVKLFKSISDQVANLTQQYGGLIWGEHGKGVRGEYSRQFFGDELWHVLQQIKTLFDPENRLNPGKICTPLDSDAKLFEVLSPMRADYDRQIPIAIKDQFAGAMNCNGNGLCFNFDVDSAMCPSMKISRNRVFSPKGRAALVREWLRLLAQANVSAEQLDFRKNEIKLTDLVEKLRNRFSKKHQDDFSHEVKAAMDTCLSCKACASQCPIKIDVPDFKAKFLYLYHHRYPRPIKDYVIANVENVAPLMAKAPVFFNAITTNPLVEQVARKYIGMVALPQLSVPSLQKQLVEINYKDRSLEQLEQLPLKQREKMLFIVQDPFTSFYDAKVVADFVRLSKKLGFDPIVLPFKPNGKAQHVKGFLTRFSKTARKQAEALNRIAKLGIPLVGVDAAVVLSYRDEYRQVLGEKRGNFAVLTSQEWLSQVLTSIETRHSENENPHTWYLFPHCTESSLLPNSSKAWQSIFAKFGEKLEVVSVGCCGMAGTFGHETVHEETSKAIYQLSWEKKLQDKDLDHCLVSGYSCRSQVKRMQHQISKHPLQGLLEILN
ncbi:membrane protein [Gallibacterium salpingitidis]|uniref:D-2-hydroxyglutarate dehydrogenase YdiJ n=1 Tax=Gallibacterium salpingitidis TaxID=505341 RepID=UPI000805A875|nr:FAD-binding and (Fe-S)-binding domain-containing protein [Gallibacterium salpingitidis]OBX09630.1 membrane protein [Gallibacterium salpingitidis]